jgi:hypothetical protein
MVKLPVVSHSPPELVENQIVVRDQTVDFRHGNLVFNQMHSLEMHSRLRPEQS